MECTNFDALQAPFPWFGGKSRVAPLVWSRFGNVPNYVEPFFGSGAVLLGRPHAPKIETVNDIDGLLCNFWRAVQADPEGTARHAVYLNHECDLHARHIFLVNAKDGLTKRLEGDPEYFDAKLAGWWVWGISNWIGSGWCSGEGPWQSVDGELVNTGNAGQGVNRQGLHLGDAGVGVNRKGLHLGDAGVGVNRKGLHLGDAGRGVNRKAQDVHAYFAAIGERMSRVRINCGDWARVTSETVTVKQGLTAVFLDPPYSDASGRGGDVYAHDSADVAHAAREWAIENAGDPRMRIALCGYEGEHAMPGSWECVPWKARGGYGSQGDGTGRENAGRERVWFSPHCLNSTQSGLFGEAA